MEKTVIICRPCGVCAGVRRALRAMDELLKTGEKPVCLLHELVHNRPVMESLYARGVQLAASPEEIPPGAAVVLSAHGTPQEVMTALERRGVALLDTTCPWVQANLRRCAEAARAGRTVLLLGNPEHAEMRAMRSYAGEKVHCVNSAAEIALLPEIPLPTAIAQTTLDTALLQELTAALTRRFGDALQGPEGVCFATAHRQKALRLAAPMADGAVILGSPHSANAAHLVRAAEACHLAVRLLERPEELAGSLPGTWRRVLLSAGASVPDELLGAALTAFDRLGFRRQEGPPAAEENAIFPAPGIAKPGKRR